jgi:hypothetical protein
MSHLDEGTLHALLDGELELSEVKEIQLHLGSCAACGSRLQDVKQFLAEADRLVGALEVPAGGIRASVEASPPPASPPPLPPKSFREPESWESPVLLLPDSTEALERRKRWMSRVRWAAMIVVVIGSGRVLLSSLRPNDPPLQLPERSQAVQVPAVVSPEETGRPEALAKKDEAPVAAPPRATPPARAPRPKPVTVEPKLLADQTAPDSAGYDTIAAAERDTGGPAVGALAAESGRRDSETAAAEPSPDETEIATRRAAAAALAELDRERLRSRANAATASLPPPQTEAQPAEAPPAPRTLEQRAQVYLRIGLDEAVRQLGRPVHVIENMSPEFIGLTQGRAVPGADAGRPVVRVVYLDSRERMVLLDQQRLRTGQAPGAPSGALRWTLGDVMLYLHGDAPADVLRSLQRRVR